MHGPRATSPGAWPGAIPSRKRSAASNARSLARCSPSSPNDTAPSTRPASSLDTQKGVRGSQHLALRHTDRLAKAGIKPSVGSVGDAYDNALAHTINGLFKAEVIHRRGPWRSMEAVEFATLGWADWFNNRHLLEPIGNVPPAGAAARYYAQAEAQALAA